MAEFDFESLSNEELIKMGALVAKMPDCDEKRAYNAELAMRCRKIWERTGKKSENWKINDLSPADADFIGEAYNIVFVEIEKYVYKLARDKNGSWRKFEQERENIQQSYFVTIFQRFPYYNGQYALTTYFVLPLTGTDTRIKAEENHMTMHEQEKSTVIRRAMREIENETGLDSDKILISDIKKKLPDESENIIRKMLSRIRDDTTSHSGDLIDSETPSNDEDTDPEKVILREETQNEVKCLLERLDDHERIAVKLRYGLFDEETGFFNQPLDTTLIGCHKAFIGAVYNNAREKSKVWLMEEKPYDSKKYTEIELQLLSEKYYVRSNYVTKYLQDAFKRMENSEYVRANRNRKSTYGMEISLTELAEVDKMLKILEDMD